jgi:hypothetical protein
MHSQTRKESTLHLFNPARRTALAALIAAMALTLAHAAPSHAAGSYVHQSCLTPSDVVDAYGGWQPAVPAIGDIMNVNQCSWGGLHSEMYTSSTFPIGAMAGWTYTAPPSTSIARFVTNWAGWTQPDAGNRGQIQVVNGAGTIGLTLEGGFDAANKRTLDWDNLYTNSITARLRCEGGGGSLGCHGSLGWASFYFPRITLADDVPPAGGATSGSVITDTTLKGNETLAYAATDAGGGVARLRLYVDGQLSSVDHIIDANNGHCQITSTDNGTWTFSSPKPCPGSVNAEESIDTTKIPDGLHTLTAKVVDAAQREATLWTATRLVANNPPVNTQLPLYADQDPAMNPVVGKAITVASDGTWTGPGLNLTRTWAQCDGHGTLSSCAAIPDATTLSYKPTSADVGHRLRLLVTATNPADAVTIASQPTGIVTSPSSAEPLTPKPTPASDAGKGSITVVVPPAPVLSPVNVSTTLDHSFRGHIAGEANGVACPQDKATLKFEHVGGGQMKLGYGRASTAQVQLTCTSNGKAIGGAQLDIATKVGSKAAVVADVTTDGAGHATLRLAKGASRAISVGYRMFADDPVARATATLKVSVNGRISLTGNRRHLHNGQALTLRGKLLGGEIPKRGVTMAVQWKDGKRWRPFAQIKTTRAGTFRYAYRFTRTSGKITYALRVQVSKGQVDYPYLPVASKAVKVTVAS